MPSPEKAVSSAPLEFRLASTSPPFVRSPVASSVIVSPTIQILSASPALDRDLRLKVLEASDGLERCVRARARHAAGPRAP